jgi:hypothetical protein
MCGEAKGLPRALHFRIPRHAAVPNPALIRIAAAPQMRPQDADNVGSLAGSS